MLGKNGADAKTELLDVELPGCRGRSGTVAAVEEHVL